MFRETSVFSYDDKTDGEKKSNLFFVEEIKTSVLPTTFYSPTEPSGDALHSALPVSSNACIQDRAEDGVQSERSLSSRAMVEEKEFIDEFGFVIDEEQKKKELLYVSSLDGKKIIRRDVKWANMALDWENTRSKRRATLKERCRKGIPARFRGAAWQLLLGSRKQMSDPANQGTYAALLSKKLSDEELTQVIERDLARTFPTNVLFREEGGVGQTFLRNILHAYACVDPEVGYVQGMGFVVAALSTQMGEEEVFWALHALMHDSRYRLRELYRPGFPMLQQFFYQLRRLIARLLPNLHQHFEKLGLEPSFYASQWFLTLFVYHFQFRALLRIWDIFMNEGWKIIFRVAIALMKWEEKRLLGMEFNDILPALKSLHKGKDPDELVSRAQSVKFKSSELLSYGDEYWRVMNQK